MTPMIQMRRNFLRIRARLHHGKTFKDALRSADGAIDLASIMVGILVLGIVAAIIAATVIGVVPWSQDQAARQSLDAVRTAEGTYRAMSDSLKFTDTATLISDRKLQNSLKVNAAASPDGACYVGASASDAGTVFWNSSVDISIRKYNTGDTSDCAGVDLGNLVSGLPTAGGAAGGSGSGTGGGGTGSGSLYYITTSADGNTAYFDIYNANGTTSSAANTTGWNDAPLSSGYQAHAVLDGKFYFASYDPNAAYPAGNGISVFDGTSVSQVTDASVNVKITSMAAFNGKIYFLGKDPVTRKSALYELDGSTATMIDATGSSTTAPTIGLNTLAYAYGSSLAVFNGKLYYPLADDGALGVFDGTQVLADATNVNMVWHGPVVVGDSLYFAGQDGNLWQIATDGSLNPADAVSNTLNVAGGVLYNSPDNGTTWHKITGTGSPVTTTDVPGEPFDVGTKMYMMANGNTAISEWNGTAVVKTTPLPAGVTYNDGPVPSATTDHTALFIASDTTSGQQVWSFDGTSFTRVSNLSVSAGGAYVGGIHTVGGTAAMDLSDNNTGLENLYVSVNNGTAQNLTDHTYPIFVGGTAQ